MSRLLAKTSILKRRIASEVSLPDERYICTKFSTPEEERLLASILRQASVQRALPTSTTRVVDATVTTEINLLRVVLARCLSSVEGPRDE